MKNINIESSRNGFLVSRLIEKRAVILCFGILFSAFTLSTSLSAQQLNSNDIAPPPLKFLSKPEKKLLEDETDIKKRTALALVLMDSRIKKAEECDTRNDFSQMYEELGGFNALMDYTLNFLNRNNSNSKNLNNFKKYEMGLRGFPSRIELLRRELPVKYEYYLADLLKNIRDTRSKAIEPFFSDTVVPNN